MSRLYCRNCKQKLEEKRIDLIPGGGGGLHYGKRRHDGVPRVIWSGAWCSPECLMSELKLLMEE